MKNDDFSIEEILNDVKRLTGEQPEEERLWTLAEIDELIAEDKQSEPERAAEEESGAAVDGEAEEIDLKAIAMNNVIDTDFHADDAEDVITEESAASDKESDSEAAEEFIGDVADFIDEFTEHDEAQEEPETEANAEAQEEPMQVETELTDSADTDSDEIEPLIDSVSADDGVAPQGETEEEAEYVPGQISIEKTRVFNEIEGRGKTDDSIDHQIGSTKIIRTGEIQLGGGMEHDPYRERFFNKPELDIEKTKDHLERMKDQPRQTIEKPGVIVRKSELDKTGEDGLSPVPTLIDPAEEYDAQQRREMETQSAALKKNAFEDDNQMMLEGFGEEEEIEIVSEAQEEEKLRKIRRERAKNFKLFPNLDDIQIPDGGETPDEEEGVQENGDTIHFKIGGEADGADDNEQTDADGKEESVPVREKVRVAREFFGPKDSQAVFDIFTKDRSRKKLKMTVSAICLAVLLAGSVATSFFSSFVLFADSAAVYSAINLAVLIVVAAFNYEAFPEALEKARKKKLDSSAAVCLSLAAGILQTAVSFGFPDLVLSGTHLYAAVAIFPVLMINLADYVKVTNDLQNFLLLNRKQGEFYAVKSVENEDTAFEIGRGLMIRDPDIRYSSKVDFPYKFVEMSKTSDPTQKVYRLVLPIAAIAAVIVGLLSAVINSSIFVGITSMTGVFLMAVPSAVSVSLFVLLSIANRSLNRDKGMISGYEAVENSLEANAVAVNAADLFSNGHASLFGARTYNSMRIDEAILYTAATGFSSEGTLREVFSASVTSPDLLPAVDSLVYEEKLGCSCWILNQRVLVGNKELLKKHNVELTDEHRDVEQRILANGRKAVYLAAEGKVTAIFSVGYDGDESIAKSLRTLERNGVSILVRTTDPNVTEELIEEKFSLQKGIVNVISPVAGVMLHELSEETAENEPCRVLHNGKLSGFLNSFVSALSLNEKSKIGILLQYIGNVIGILLMALFSFTAGMNQAGAVQMILFCALWSLVVVLVPRLKR